MLWHASPVIRRSVVLMATLLAGLALPARGQLTSSDDREKPARLSIHPQGEPVPASAPASATMSSGGRATPPSTTAR